MDIQVNMSMDAISKKTLLIVRGLPGEAYGQFTSRLFGYAEELRNSNLVRSCKLALTTGPPPRFAVIPYKQGPVALLTLEVCSEERAIITAECRVLTETFTGITGCYTAECVLPVSYQKEWPDGEPTPGAGLLTLFKQAPGIEYAAFIDRWHNGHTPLSLEIHPLWNYVRNVIRSKIFPESEQFDGIVEEHFRTRRDLTGLCRFFGGFWKMGKI